MYKLFLCLRYLIKRRIAIFAMLSVCLCVAMVLIVMSVMGGFLNMVKERSRGMLGDLVVESSTLQGFPFYQEFIDEVKKQMPNEIEEATPVVIVYGVLRFQNTMTKPVQVVGVRLEETYRVNDFKGGLFYEKYYPGSTTFAARGQPALGLNVEGARVLPPDLESARQKWQAAAGAQDINDAWRFGNFEFSIDVKSFPSQLNQGQLSSELRTAIEERMFLPEAVEVSVAEKGKKWILRHRAGLDTITRDQQKLKIARSFYDGPGFYRISHAEHDGDKPGWSGKPLPGAILGTDLCADRLRSGGFDRMCYRGEPIQLMVVPFSSTGQPETAVGADSVALRYVDDCRTGVFEIDSMSVYVDFSLLQDMVNMTAHIERDAAITSDPAATQPNGSMMPARATQVQIKLNSASVKSQDDVIKARDHVRRIWEAVTERKLAEYRDDAFILDKIEGPAHWVKVQTWEEKQARFIGAVEKEKYLVTCLFGVISVVAVLLVGVIFYMIVQQKTRDIGIIKSVGATSAGVAGIFLTYGAAVGVVGGALGTAIGAIFVWYINDIQDLLILIGGNAAQVWNPEVYNFDKIPNTVNPWDAVRIYGVAILASMLGSLVAAWKASRVWPVEALRYE